MPSNFRATKRKPKKVNVDFSGKYDDSVCFKATKRKPKVIKVNFSVDKEAKQ
jgi:hypothetical protein